MLKRFPKLVAAAVAAGALVPAAAGAASITYENGGLVYRGEGSQGVNLLVAQAQYDGVTYLRLGDDGLATINTDKCFHNQWETSALCQYDPNRPLTIIGSDAKDSISLFSAGDVPDSMPITIDGRGGDDQIKDTYDGQAGRTLIGGAGNDTIQGFGGDDTIDGGDGNDEVDGGAGNDIVRGGAGDDVMWGDHYQPAGSDVIDGGPGTDQIDEWTIPGDDVNPLPSVSLNGAADDGRPGESDNVTNVEKYSFHINTTFVGSDANETVEVTNVDEGSSNLSGGGGDDVLKAYDTDDTVDGGAGNDRLEGGLGNDKITGGPGKDVIMGDSSSSYCSWLGSCKVPFGADTIYAQDGEADTIDCGVGEDTAYVDAIDTVTNCETANKSGAAPTTGTPTGPATGGPAPAASGATLAIAGARLRALLSGKLTVGVPCATACRISLTATRSARTVATGRATLLAGGTAKVKLKVARSARKSLKRSKQVKLAVAATITNADKTKQRLTRSVTLR